MVFDQNNYAIRCEWGAEGVERLASTSDAIIIVDVLRFTTCVDVATANGAQVYPFRERGTPAQAYAAELDAELAVSYPHATGTYSLSPTSLQNIASGTRLVLPSPNGSTLSMMTGDVPTLAGCLRNAGAVARAALTFGPRVSVIPAGERWRPDRTLRVALEDWLGAGAIIGHLTGNKSPEAGAAEALFRHYQDDLPHFLREIISGRELLAEGRANDVALAAALDVSDTAPFLYDGAYYAAWHKT